MRAAIVVERHRSAEPLGRSFPASVRRAALVPAGLFRPWFVSDALSLSPGATVGFLEGATEHSDVRTAGRALVRDDPRRDLEQIRCPVVVLWGARDPQLPLDDAFEFARRLRAKLRVVADCGHLVIGERPEACLDALAELGRH